MAIITVKDITMIFGGLAALTNVNFTLERGSLVGLIGPNGAGKTTIFNVLTGVYSPTSGAIEYKQHEDSPARNINGLKPHIISKIGISRTFQNIRLFKDLTVLDNIRIAIHQNVGYGLPSAFFRLPSYYKEEKEVLQKSKKIMDIFGLETKKNELAKNLPYGEQRKLEIARALATNPTLLLLDEPAAGMNPNETAALTDLINWIWKEFNLSILLIEHDMSLVMKICQKIIVLNYGMVIAEGTPEEIRNNQKVIEAYLGGDVLHA
ncbi:MAG: ABC transporter ATP-binding protein [Clostridiaceae bacterium]|jgi:branched-chain amino acid transport system ATP-binding protein|nr:ABC transporter ATP-binding protein [Clostridiaceae bacterium]